MAFLAFAQAGMLFNGGYAGSVAPFNPIGSFGASKPPAVPRPSTIATAKSATGATTGPNIPGFTGPAKPLSQVYNQFSREDQASINAIVDTGQEWDEDAKLYNYNARW